jgi:hypothetical protein
MMDLDAEQVVDVSHLQHFDRNWDGRNPKEGEKEPTAYRYIILVWGSGCSALFTRPMPKAKQRLLSLLY